MCALLVPATLVAILGAMKSQKIGGIRDCILRATTLWCIVLVVLTEILGALQLIRQGVLIAAWAAAFSFAIYRTGRGLRQKSRYNLGVFRDPILRLFSISIVGILALTAITAVFSPPNSADAMAYHMPRVVYWAEQASIRFFPTPYLNQIMLQPLAEYFMLHTYVLSGGDRFINFVQWVGSLGSVIGVSLL